MPLEDPFSLTFTYSFRDRVKPGTKYYVAFQYLINNNNSSLNVLSVILVGKTYSYENPGL